MSISHYIRLTLKANDRVHELQPIILDPSSGDSEVLRNGQNIARTVC